MSTKTDSGAGAAPQPASAPDKIDFAILKVLRRDGRISMTDLAEQVNVSRANAHARVARLRDTGAIKSFTIEVDPRLVGQPVASLIGVKMDFHEWRNIWEEIEQMDEVAYQALTTGEFDLMVLVRATRVEAIRDVILERLNAIEGIHSTTTFILFDESGPRVTLP